MTVPNFLSSSYCDFRFTKLWGITDVSSILTALTAQLVTAPAAANKWTENPAGTFQSPSDASGRYIKCAFTRVAATNLQMVLTDHNVVTICTRRIQISGATNVDLYTGKFYVVIDSLVATPEIMLAFLLDPSPEALASVPNPAFGNAYRSAADAADGNCDYGELYAIDNAGVALLQRLQGKSVNTGGSVFPYVAQYFRAIVNDFAIRQNVGGFLYWAGRMPQALMWYEGIAQGSIRKAALDNSNFGLFRGTSWTLANNGRLCVRYA